MRVQCSAARRISWLAATCALVGCSSPDIICDLRRSELSATVREAQAGVSGTFDLPPGMLERSARLRVHVDGLSELGTSHPYWGDSYVTVPWRLRYAPPAPAGAQLPEVLMTMSLVYPDGSRGPGRSWNRSERWDGFDIFSCIGGEQDGCCMPGATSCTTEVELSFARDDLLFPEVQVDWSSEVHVAFSGCQGDGPLSLDVEVVEDPP